MNMPTNEELKAAFANMIAAKTALNATIESVFAASENLKLAETAIINANAADPKALGGNEAARNAAIRIATVDERQELEEAERTKRDAQLAFDLAIMEKDCLIWQVKNEQVAASLAEAGIVEVI